MTIAAHKESEQIDVRILLVGDEGVGKTSLIMALVEDAFPISVPARANSFLIPPDVTPERVATAIVDYSSREQSEVDLIEEIKLANVICIVYAVDKDSTMDRVRSYWLSLIQKTLGGADHGKPIILVGNKSDGHTSFLDKILPIMNEYLEIETCVESSAKSMKNVSEIFYYAQKAVLFPTLPLFKAEEKELTPKCKKALVRIFKLSDSDNDGLLSDYELNQFQIICFGVPLTASTLQDVKNEVADGCSEGIRDDSVTLQGFLYLNQLFIHRGRHETTWSILKKFGYDLSLQLKAEYLYPPLKVEKGQSTELSDEGIQFITCLFQKYDEDKDWCLSPSELTNLFSVCPSFPWAKEALYSVETNARGWVTFDGYISLWIMNTFLNVTQVMEQFAYLGFNVRHRDQQIAFKVTQDRRVDIEEKFTTRKVFQCHIIGPKDAGKTVFCRSFVGKSLQDTSRMNRKLLLPYVINWIKLKDERKYLLLHEVDVYSENDLLTSYEKSADVICLLYDASNATSFAYCAAIYLKYFYRTKVPCLILSTKGDRFEAEQNFEQQPSDFCHTHQLPRPLRFRADDIGKRDSDVFTQLASLAVYPHLKRARFAYDLWQDGGWKMLAVGAGVIAIFGFLMGNLK